MATENETLVKYGRIAFYIICAIPVVFALQAILVVMAMPVLSEMFEDFGSRLPAVTAFVFKMRYLWAFLAVIFAILPYVFVSVKVISKRNTSLWIMSGFVNFCLAQFLTGAVLLPVFDLGAVSGVES